ncbi:MAG: hypothetical protein RLZZ450_3390 [Pseudomonadota bacterium]|jgi:hypothetical protein
MSKVGAQKAREAKKPKQTPPAGQTPAAPEQPKFIACFRCMLPHPSGTTICDSCKRRGRWFPMDNTEGMTLEGLRRWAASVEEASGRRVMAARRWAASLYLYALRLADPNDALPDEEINMFYIRLHGVFAELMPHLAGGFFANLTEAEALTLTDPNAPQYRAAHVSATEAAKAIHSSLTRDEHIYAEWRRHADCHVFQNAFTVQLQGKIGRTRTLKVRSPIKALSEGGEIEIEELNAATSRVLAAHGNDDNAVARALATKLKPAVEQLATAWERLPG